MQTVDSSLQPPLSKSVTHRGEATPPHHAWYIVNEGEVDVFFVGMMSGGTFERRLVHAPRDDVRDALGHVLPLTHINQQYI